MTKHITPLRFATYIAVIENSVGSYTWKNLYVDIDGVREDATQDGWLSCAFFTSSVLTLCKYIQEIHGTVSSTVRDLQQSGWIKIDKPKKGSVIVWKQGDGLNRHAHIGFYIGDNMAISNDSRKKHPVCHPWTFGGKRHVDMILWKPGIDLG